MSNSDIPKLPATDKERYEQCIGMLKAYYDAIESRLAQNIAAYLAALGWVITSSAARQALVNPRAFYLVLCVIVIVFVMYVANVFHYVRRWREIRKTVERLSYIENEYFARYELPDYTPFTYVMPVAVLFALLVLLVSWAHCQLI
jgi:hypothetical protein